MESKPSDATLIHDALRRSTMWHGRTDFAEVAGVASALGVSLTRPVWNELAGLTNDERALPTAVSGFLVGLTRASKPSRVLNLWCGEGSLASAIADATPTVELTAVDPQGTALDVARHFDSQHRVTWIVGRPRNIMNETMPGPGGFDLLISTAPWGVRPERYEFVGADGTTRTLQDEEGRIDLIRYAPVLGESGTAVLLTTNSILLPTKSKKFLEALSTQGLWLQAAISLPAGTFSPRTSVPGVIAIFSKSRSDDVFMAEMPKTPEAQARLLKNMASRRPGKSPELGVLVPSGDLVPLEAVLADRDVIRGVKSMGVEVAPLADAALAINRPIKREGRLTFDDAPNSFFMPMIGFGPARLDLPEKISKEWVQVVLDPEKALAEHAIRWLSSSLGRRAREARTSGTTISRVSAAAINALPLPVLPVAEQDQAVALDVQLAAVTAEVQQMREDLLNRPRRLREIARRAHRLTRRDDKPDWIDSLPLPLATVGRAYYARQDLRLRIDSLFHFFEAMAEFHASVLLSGMSSDAVYFQRAREDLLGPVEDRRRYYERATLGGWTTMATRLSKELRRLLSRVETDKEPGRDTVMRWFGRPEPEWLEMITSSALYSTLDEAKRRRNDWSGHGGAASDTVVRARLAELETLLASVRSVVADRWDDATLVTPVGMSLREGTLETTVDVLTGTAVPFRQDRLVTSDPLDSAYLYLVHAGGPSTLRLVPLIRMMPSPSSANIACYFYSRVSDGEVRYVSYYYDEDPEAIGQRGDAASGAIMDALGLNA